MDTLEKLIEVRWHGRGGQGAKTGAQILAEVFFEKGYHIQAFPEYGAERSGAPMKAFDRISEGEILLHCQVENPDIVVVIDPTLLSAVNVTEGLKENGVLLVNTPQSPAEIKRKLGLRTQKVYTLDATKIALEEIKANFPNTPILGALAKIIGELPIESFEEHFRSKFESKLPPDKVEANVRAIRRGYEEVQGE